MKSSMTTPKLTVGRKAWVVEVSFWTMKTHIRWIWEDSYYPKWQRFPTRQEAQAACARLREALRGARVIR